ncbi:MAG: hypothetical protein GX754_06095 [Clostridiaceae bacterium]|nr:hypothetical protein [Clostridiaceae bacterium]
MTYRELLELTKKYPNPFSISKRKTRMFDFELENLENAFSKPAVKSSKPNDEKTDDENNTYRKTPQKRSNSTITYREALKSSRSMAK